jgi:hypothetical protein
MSVILWSAGVLSRTGADGTFTCRSHPGKAAIDEQDFFAGGASIVDVA